MRMIPIVLSLLLAAPADAGRKKKKADPMAATCSTMTEAGIAANTGNVYVGSSSVDSTNGYVLDAGESVVITIDNLATVYLDVDTNGEGVTYIAS